MRKLAVEILSKIEDENSNSTKLLNEYTKNLKDKDNKFLREIVYGTLENRIYIDYIIKKLCKLRIKKFDKRILNILRISIYQLLFLNKVPDFAVLNEAVDLTKIFKLKKFSAFVNGTLRNFLRNKEEFSKIQVNTKEEEISLKYSTNIELVNLLLKEYREEKTKEILENSLAKPHFSIRISSFNKQEDQILKELEKLGYDLKKCELVKNTYFVKNPTNILKTENFIKGDFTVQDIASILVSESLNPKKDSTVLDICAAPGGKTSHMAFLMNNTGKILANDIVKSKLKNIQENLKRLNITNVQLSNFDGTILQEQLKEKFDFILCDLICSGSGVIDRKPEIKLFRTKEKIEQIIKIQRQIFDNAIKYLKPNGKILYSTCSILSLENEDNIKYFLEKYKDLKIEKINFLNEQVDYIKLLPEKEKHNGFFIVKFKKVIS